MKVRFDFEGGCEHGKSVDGETDLQAAKNPARQYMWLTNSGTVGARFRIPRAHLTDAQFAELVPDELQHIWRAAHSPGEFQAMIHKQQVTPAARKLFYDRVSRKTTHIYEVKSRSEIDGRLVLRLQFIGDEDEADGPGSA
jgi:hypothetical protein